MSDYRLYTGNEILNLPPDNNKPLIDGLLWEQDIVFLVAKDKVGKSILAQQMAFCLAGGEPFLGEYFTAKSLVLYVQLEGKLPQTRDNFHNMLQGIQTDMNNLKWIYEFGLPLNHESGLKKLCDYIDKHLIEFKLPNPKVIILDPLYMCIMGDLNKQEDASNMCRNFRRLSDRYGCSLLICHHEHKAKLGPSGNPVFEGDDAIYGSMVWKAFADHTLMLTEQLDKSRKLTCKTQRTGKVIEEINLNLLKPMPLLFELKGDIAPGMRKVEIHLSNGPQTIEDICKATMMSYNAVHRAITHLRKIDRVEGLGDTRPRIWRLK